MPNPVDRNVAPAKHTPGPWKVVTRPYEVSIVSESSVMVADLILMEGQTYGNGQREANARLIAAAPELLEALERCEAMVSTTDGPPDWDRVRAAIRKAKGEPQ